MSFDKLMQPAQRNLCCCCKDQSLPSPRSRGNPIPIRGFHLENKLRERLGTKIQLRYRAGKGALDIRFYSDDELERIMQILGVSAD